MNHDHSHDVIVIGGGMVGLSLALGAARQGLTVALVERHEAETAQPEAGRFAARVSALSPHSRRWLQTLGAWDRLPPGRACPYRRMAVWDGQGGGAIAFDADEVQADTLGHILENHWLTRALWQCAEADRSVRLLAGRTLTDWHEDETGVTVELDDGDSLSAPVLAACDGKFSRMRDRAGIATRDWSYHQTALVTSIHHRHDHAFTARQVFLDTGPLAFLPLTDETGTRNWSSIVWSADTDRAEQLLSLDDSAFLTELNRASEGCLGEIDALDPRFGFPLTQQHARDYWRGRVVLLGDAAHAIHPLAGQGVNLGFLDAQALSDVWRQARAQGLSPGDAWVLRRYQRRRQAHNLASMAAMEGFKRLFGSDHPAPVLLRNRGLALVNRLAWSKRPLIRAAMGEIGV